MHAPAGMRSLTPDPSLPTIDGRPVPNWLGPDSHLAGGGDVVPFCVPSESNNDCIGTAYVAAHFGRDLLEVCPYNGDNSLTADAVRSRRLVAVHPDQARKRCGHSIYLSYGHYQVQAYVVGSCKGCNVDEVLITSTVGHGLDPRRKHRVFRPIHFFVAETSNLRRILQQLEPAFSADSMQFAATLASACLVVGSVGLGMAAAPPPMHKLKASYLTQAVLVLPMLSIDDRPVPATLGPGSTLTGGDGVVPFCELSDTGDCTGKAYQVANLGRNFLEVCPSDGDNALTAEAVRSRHLVALNPDQARNRCGHSMYLSYGNYQVQNKDEFLISPTVGHSLDPRRKHRVFSPIRFFVAEWMPGI
ncbi:MAG: hypothetical protein M1826_005673 [Phylliscum demangeonii]|nr:MAG: hypothetical protein M1826_005673 [Phylliscum demangeonii]